MAVALDYEIYKRLEKDYNVAEHRFNAVKQPWLYRARDIARYLQAARCSIYIIDSQTGTYGLVEKSYFDGPGLDHEDISVSEHLVVYVVKCGKSLTGYFTMSLSDFLLDDWRAYLEPKVTELKAARERSYLEEDEKRERAEYERLKRKYEVLDGE